MSLSIGIVGLGLIGASIEKRIKAIDPKGTQFKLKTVSRSQNREYQLRDLSDVDILLLCGPQSTIKKQLQEIALIISKSSQEGSVEPEDRAFAKTIITDVASTKLEICNFAQQLGLENFVGGHPMAGTEKQGYDAGFAELFEGCNWILTESSARTAQLETLITATLGAGNLVIMDAASHDQGVAAISHIPLLASLGLGNLLKSNPQAKNLVGPGFKGMVRLAKGNESLSQEIIKFNKNNIKELWKVYKDSVDALIESSGDVFEEEMRSIKKDLETV